jgi:hypothetical protein
MTEVEIKDHLATVAADLRKKTTKFDGLTSKMAAVEALVTSLEELKR